MEMKSIEFNECIGKVLEFMDSQLDIGLSDGVVVLRAAADLKQEMLSAQIGMAGSKKLLEAQISTLLNLRGGRE